jgi:hypothetical protein
MDGNAKRNFCSEAEAVATEDRGNAEERKRGILDRIKRINRIEGADG